MSSGRIGKRPLPPDTTSHHHSQHPNDLAVQDSLLYVTNGYSIYRVNGEEEPVPVKKWEKPSIKDFIWSGNHMFIMGFNGVHIVNVIDPMEPKEIFSIQ